MENHQSEETDQTYTLEVSAKCPVDATEVRHTILYKKATCTRIDDTVMHFRCDRDSKCVKCQQNYI